MFFNLLLVIIGIGAVVLGVRGLRRLPHSHRPPPLTHTPPILYAYTHKTQTALPLLK